MYTKTMQIIAVPTPLLSRTSNLAAEIVKRTTFSQGDIIVISSKVVALTEGVAVSLASFTPSAQAVELSKVCHQDPRFTEFILSETRRMNGEVVGVSPHVLLTSLRIAEKKGRILCPNAGADLSNIDDDHAIGWPLDPVLSAKKLSEALGVPVIISDSCCVPGRLGVIAFALTCAGIDPFRSEVGHRDLFGKKLQFTQEAVADQLAVAANAVMGNSAQSIPAAIIRDAGIPPSDFSGWVDGIDPENDLFRGILKA